MISKEIYWKYKQTDRKEGYRIGYNGLELHGEFFYKLTFRKEFLLKWKKMGYDIMQIDPSWMLIHLEFENHIYETKWVNLMTK
jgi:hypothetical protein